MNQLPRNFSHADMADALYMAKTFPRIRLEGRGGTILKMNCGTLTSLGQLYM